MSDFKVFELERRQMVEAQLRKRGIRDQRVLDAMLHVPRHEFVPPEYLEAAYHDRALPIGPSGTISQPYIVAAMTQMARVEPGDKALEIGTGSGYQSAILSFLGARVFSLELNPKLADAARARLSRLGYCGIDVICSDGTEGYVPAAPYQVILVTAGSPQVPPALIDQLAEGGRLVIPVGDLESQWLQLLERTSEGLSSKWLDACQFVPLTGKHGWPPETARASRSSRFHII
jgi:protein-L-isoaspartate(D-aspartate) O-methyltransferase